jgi:hypothetical protein
LKILFKNQGASGASAGPGFPGLRYRSGPAFGVAAWPPAVAPHPSNPLRLADRRRLGLTAKIPPKKIICPGKWGKIRERMRFFDA